MSLQVPTGDRDTNRHVRALVLCAHSMAFKVTGQLDFCAGGRVSVGSIVLSQFDDSREDYEASGGQA